MSLAACAGNVFLVYFRPMEEAKDMFAAMLGVKKSAIAAAPDSRGTAAPAPEARSAPEAVDALAVQKLVVEEMAVEKAALEESLEALESDLVNAKSEFEAACASRTAYACERFWYEARVAGLLAEVDELESSVARMRAENDELEEKLARMGRRLAESRRLCSPSRR